MEEKCESRSDLEVCLQNIMSAYTDRDFLKDRELQQKKLLGSIIWLAPRDLVNILFDIEREFGVQIPEKQIVDGNFDTFDHICEIICNELYGGIVVYE